MKGAARELGLIGIAALALACGGGAETAERSGAAPAGAEEATAPADTIVVAGFQMPESVLYDPEADVYLVSNVDGPPAAKDGNGYVSRLAPDGTVLEPKWIDGAAEGVELNGPKGMALSGDTLFVADIDAVRLFDRTSGAPLAAWPVPGATFLNDVVVGPGGRIYVSDTGIRITDSGVENLGTAAIWRFAADGTPEKVKDGDETGVNGLALAPVGLVAVTLGPGKVFALSDSGRTELPGVGGTFLDGVVAPGDGSLLVSDWQTASVYRIDPEGKVTTVLEGVDSPADIGWDPKRSRLLVPSFNGNEVRIVPLKL
jgi:sugar lactone lactonase YvrE